MRNRASTPDRVPQQQRARTAELVERVDSWLNDRDLELQVRGVQALGELADLSPAHRAGCVRVLCATVRSDPAPAVVTAALAVIRSRLRSTDPARSWSGLRLDLSGVRLRDGDLTGIRLDGGTLRLSRSRIAGTLDLTGAEITGGGGLLLDRSTVTGAVLLDGLELSDGQVVLDHLVLDGGEISIERARLTGGHLMTGEAELRSGRMSLTGSTVSGATVTFHGSTLAGADLVLEDLTLSSGRCLLTSLMLTAGSISFRRATIVRPLLSLRMSTLAGGRFDLGGVEAVEPAEPVPDAPDGFEGVYLIPPVEIDWGPWADSADAILDLREGVDVDLT
jgi:uncharacterized protein YjbI with pentapeptide repeats